MCNNMVANFTKWEFVFVESVIYPDTNVFVSVEFPYNNNVWPLSAYRYAGHIISVLPCASNQNVVKIGINESHKYWKYIM